MPTRRNKKASTPSPPDSDDRAPIESVEAPPRNLPPNANPARSRNLRPRDRLDDSHANFDSLNRGGPESKAITPVPATPENRHGTRSTRNANPNYSAPGTRNAATPLNKDRARTLRQLALADLPSPGMLRAVKEDDDEDLDAAIGKLNLGVGNLGKGTSKGKKPPPAKPKKKQLKKAAVTKAAPPAAKKVPGTYVDDEACLSENDDPAKEEDSESEPLPEYDDLASAEGDANRGKTMDLNDDVRKHRADVLQFCAGKGWSRGIAHNVKSEDLVELENKIIERASSGQDITFFFRMYRVMVHAKIQDEVSHSLREVVQNYAQRADDLGLEWLGCGGPDQGDEQKEG